MFVFTCTNGIVAKQHVAFYCRVTRCPVFNSIVQFLREVSRCPNKGKTGCQIVPFFNSTVLFITDTDYSLWHTSRSWCLDA
jgi:hypothetical protein